MSDATTSNENLPIANIALAEIINEVTGEKFYFDTASSADAKPDLSKGKEDILRVRNRIVAMNRTEDICIGYTIKLKDNVFSPKLMSLIDGGTLVDSVYEGPEMGKVVEKVPFTLNLYSEEKDYDSSTIQYACFSFKHNKGKPVDFKLQDGKFYVPQFESTSRPKRGENPVYISFLSSLPNGQAGGNTPIPNIPTPTTASGSTPGVSIGTDYKVTWTYLSAVDNDDITVNNFKITRLSDGSIVAGNVTVDSTGKIVTFVPTSIENGVTYSAVAAAIRKVGSSDKTTPVSTVFTTTL
ncbi:MULTISPECIES: hypothetical protein [Clostridium]|uniref:hypothetical protein n=1 Tax=Clostridium TaxID=1485 RepID=UPI0009C0F54D|nr:MULTISPECIES: hypothetical protein [Clostridium]PJI07043.1 hypothetical protein CUB90_03820 [Clostridium sp. CT7]